MAAEKDIRLIVGLGNPGADYVHTRHNVGFLAVDELAEALGARVWTLKHGCMIARTACAGREVLLAKPQSFMNASGGPVSKLMRAEKIVPAELLVIHDEVDLEAGVVRTRFGGGLNAHNGLRSLKDKLGTPDFWRVRAGIGRPPGKMDVATYVLRQLKGEMLDELLDTASRAARAAQTAIG